MATASDYLKYNNPINSPSDPSRGFSDQIYIDFTSGKKSLDEQLKEIDLANKQLALEQQKLMPTDSAAQEFGWSKAAAERAAEQSTFDRKMAEAEEARKAQQQVWAGQEAGYAGEANKRANVASRMDTRKFKFDRRMSKQEMGLKQASEARSAQAAGLQEQVTRQQMGESAAAEARAAALAPIQMQAAQADVASKNLAVQAATKAANPVTQGLQYYTAPILGTAQQQQWAIESMGNPGFIPKGASFAAPKAGQGSGYDPKTGRTYYI